MNVDKQNDTKNKDYEKNAWRPGGEIQEGILYPCMGLVHRLTWSPLPISSFFAFFCLKKKKKWNPWIPSLDCTAVWNEWLCAVLARPVRCRWKSWGDHSFPNEKAKFQRYLFYPFLSPFLSAWKIYTLSTDIAVILHVEKQKHIKTMSQEDQKTLATYTWISCYRKNK